MAGPPKQYGLILKGKKAAMAKTPSNLSFAFNDEEEEDEAGLDPSSTKALTGKPSVTQTRVKKIAQAQHEQALAEDPNIFDYDAAYDVMQQSKREEEKVKQAADVVKKPKYMHKLMQSAAKRELEHVAREERKQHKERQEEGEQFADKDTFVTGAYRKQMEELQKYKDDEAAAAIKEAQMDVRKQDGLSGFYRFQLNQDNRNPIECSQSQSSTTNTTNHIKEETQDDDKSNIEKIRKPTESKSMKVYRKHEKRTLNKDKDTELANHSDEEEDKTQVEEEPKSMMDASSDEDTSHTNDKQLQDVAKSVRRRKSSTSQSQSDRKSTETRIEAQKRRFFTPSPEPSEQTETLTHTDTTEATNDKEKPKELSKKSSSKSHRHDSDSEEEKEKQKKRMKMSSKTDNVDDKKDVKAQIEEDPSVTRYKRLRALFKRHNNTESIDLYRIRYFQRKADGLIVPPCY